MDCGKYIVSLINEKYNFIALYGDLGAGKTTLVKGMAKALGIDNDITSPTFTIVNEYKINNRKNLYHFDMYRINSMDSLYSTGFFDYFDKNNIIVTEWTENIEFALPESYIEAVIIYGENENERNIKVTVIG